MVKTGKKKTAQRVLLGVFAALSVLGVLVCGYGYAAMTQDLVVTGQAKVMAEAEIRNVAITYSVAGLGAAGYESTFTAKSASLYPLVGTGAAGGSVLYNIGTCNTSKDKYYELVGVNYPIKTLQGMTMALQDVTVGVDNAYGTIVAPGACVISKVGFSTTSDTGQVGAVQVDYEWKEWKQPSGGFTSTYMQDLTPRECLREVKVGETKQLIDKRDGNKYWVTKLADNNCWMTQNLAFDIKGANQTLYPETSDVQTVKAMPEATDTKVLDGTPHYDASVAANNVMHSWSMGKGIVAATAHPVNTTVYCYDPAYYMPNGKVYASAKTTDNLGVKCGNWGFLDVSSGWTTGNKADIGSYTLPNGAVFSGPVTVDVANKRYDEHYLLGNYYTWGAATAGSGAATMAEYAYAPESICPKGWQLPRDGTDDGGFYNLLTAYGYSVNSSGQLIGSGTIDAQRDPLYMVRAGWMDTYDGYMTYVGQMSTYWLGMAAKYEHNLGTTAYGMYFDFEHVYPFGAAFYRFFGFPVRCVLK